MHIWQLKIQKHQGPHGMLWTLANISQLYSIDKIAEQIVEPLSHQILDPLMVLQVGNG